MFLSSCMSIKMLCSLSLIHHFCYCFIVFLVYCCVRKTISVLAVAHTAFYWCFHETLNWQVWLGSLLLGLNLLINLFLHNIEPFSDGAMAGSVQGAWNGSLPGSKSCSRSPKPQTRTIIRMGTDLCCWKPSAVKTSPALITALLAPVHYSLSVLCVHLCSGEDNMALFFFFLWEMSSKNLGLPNTHERDWTVFPLLLLFLTPAAVRWSQRWPQWWQEWPEELHKWEQREQREAVPVSWTMSSRLPENIQH